MTLPPTLHDFVLPLPLCCIRSCPSRLENSRGFGVCFFETGCLSVAFAVLDPPVFLISLFPPVFSLQMPQTLLSILASHCPILLFYFTNNITQRKSSVPRFPHFPFHLAYHSLCSLTDLTGVCPFSRPSFP